MTLLFANILINIYFLGPSADNPSKESWFILSSSSVWKGLVVNTRNKVQVMQYRLYVYMEFEHRNSLPISVPTYLSDFHAIFT